VFGLAGGCVAGYQIGRKDVAEKAEAVETSGVRTGKPPKPAEAGPRLPAGVISRQEFEAAVRGKTRDQVTAAVGRPDETREKVPAGTYNAGLGQKLTFTYDWWYYKGRVMNDATGRPYAAVGIRFGGGGTVEQIEYP